MTLTLRIENFDSLPDGGPLWVTTNGKPLQIGRSASMDWTLPDPQRHISGHHFDISYRDGQYYLTDVSTNGVFLEGQRHRIEGAHLLRQGERFQVGHYFIVVALDGQTSQTPSAIAPSTPVSSATDSDPWAIGGTPVAPIDPNPPRSPAAFEDFASDFISTGGAPAPAAAPIPSAPAAPLPAGSSSPFDIPTPQPAAPVSPSTPTAPAPPGPTGADVLRAFCEGAGLQLPPGVTADAEAFAFELGRTLRGTSSEAMAMLNDRDIAKKFIKTGDRTMLSSNPLKNLPDVSQALEVMFIQPRDGFMSGGDALIDALGDIHRHQRAVFAAIQPALIKLMANLAPEDIEEAVNTGILTGGKRKSWDEFVRRWDKMTTEHENGMLDVFLAHFAESYTKANGGPGV